MRILGAKPRSDPETIKRRLEGLREAFQIVADEMHRCDGTQPDSQMGGKDMAVAKTHLETAWLWAKEAVEQS